MKKHLLIFGIIFLFFFVVFQPAFANENLSIRRAEQQPKGSTFMRTFGGIDYEDGRYVKQTKDGGYIITGRKADKVWLIKIHSFGFKIWDKTFEGTSGKCVQQTTDGGYILVGVDRLIKTDRIGNKEWDKIFGDSLTCVRQTSDEGYIITGRKDDQVYLVKTDKDGNIIWHRTYGGRAGYCVQQTTDGGYIVTGSSAGSNSRVLLIKTDSNGTLLLRKYTKMKENNIGYYVQQTNDSGYIVTGRSWDTPKTYNLDREGDIFLLRFDSYGSLIWKKIIDYEGIGHCVQQTTDGGFIVSGTRFSDFLFFVFDNVRLIKTDSHGNKEWATSIKSRGGGEGMCVQQTTDGGYIITGNTGLFNSDVLLIKTNKNGTLKSKAVTDNMLLLRILERFPLLQRLLDVWRHKI